jgi:hypothetical protein
MDEGLPIGYPVLEKDVPVYASGGELVGTVDHVVAAPEEDIFHGIVLKTNDGQRFIAAEFVASLHEHGVDLRIDEGEAAASPTPHGGAPVYKDVEPGVAIKPWRHFKDTMLGHSASERFKEEK